MDKKHFAYMEAGQAVASTMLGRDPVSVSLDPSRSLGRRLMKDHESWTHPSGEDSIESRRSRQEQATMYLAGTQALVMSLGNPVSVRFSDEMEWIRTNVDRLARRYDFMPMVEAVANELLSRRELSHEDVAEVVRTVRLELDTANLKECVSI